MERAELPKRDSIAERKAAKIADFDINGVGRTNGAIFGFPFTCEEAGVVIIPAPWDVTTSYGAGASRGPAAVLQASPQADFYVPDIPGAWEVGIAMDVISEDLLQRNAFFRQKAALCISKQEEGIQVTDPSIQAMCMEINAAGAEMNDWMKASASRWLEAGKAVGVLGGDHSVPLGFLHALAEYYPNFGILQIDAHADLRNAYEGFEFSHASIMYNALKLSQVSALVQIGLRDYCEDEAQRIQSAPGRIRSFDQRLLKRRLFQGGSWHSICAEALRSLPENVYVSFDIDGLDRMYAPHTGTPTPGGLLYDEAVYLIEEVVQSGRRIIGFDLCEVAPGTDEWDANVGARLLYLLAVRMAKSQGMYTKRV